MDKELERYLRHHPGETEEMFDTGYMKWWCNHYPSVVFISKRTKTLREFMDAVMHIACRAGIELMPLIQNMNYYMVVNDILATKEYFIKRVILEMESQKGNLGISQNDNEVALVLKDFL